MRRARAHSQKRDRTTVHRRHHPLPCPARRGRAAFTLVELLVVIAILGLLGALLLPALKYAREKVRHAGGRANFSFADGHAAAALPNEVYSDPWYFWDTP